MPTNLEPTLLASTLASTLAPLLTQLFEPSILMSGLLSGPRARLPESVLKVEITPVLLRGRPQYQFAYHQARKVTHRNLIADTAKTEILALLASQFKQAVFHTAQGDVHVTLNKRFEATVRDERGKEKGERKKENPAEDMSQAEEHVAPEQQSAENNAQQAEPTAEGANTFSFPLSPFSSPHDRLKNHILPEGQPLPFLVGLGVMTVDGRVIAAKRDKFRQINRFLEMVSDVVAPLESQARAHPDRPLGIVDFGCGKAYLTFALYHYLHKVRGLNITLVGVDVKADVLAQCTALAAEIGYTGLHFVTGDIQNAGPELRQRFATMPDTPMTLDMVVALHACDTATDDALAQAVAANAVVILAAPCCQHELRGKIQNDALASMLHYGIVRDRLSALVTDTLRAEFLSANGYTVQMLEFIEAEHTPKNILLRAVQKSPASTPTQGEAAQRQYAQLRDFWQVQPYIEQALTQAASNTPPTDTTK